jgi:hypothetical protein
MRILLALLLSSTPAWAQSRRSSHQPDYSSLLWDQGAGDGCPFQMTRACLPGCTDPHIQAPCLLQEFGCDFKICWGDAHLHVLREDTLRVLLDTPSYVVPGAIPVVNGINAFSVIRITQSPDDLYLRRGAFFLEMSYLDTPAQARAQIQWAQACATQARAQQAAFIQQSVGSDAMYRVRCGTRVTFTEVQATAPAPAAAVTPPPAEEPPPPGVKPPPTPQVLNSNDPQQRIYQATDQDLRDQLTTTGLIRIDGNRIYMDDGTGHEIQPFSPDTDPDARMRAMNQLDQDDRTALKELYGRNVSRTIQEAQQNHAAPDGQHYQYNDRTGQAELQQDPPPGPGKQ